MRTLLRSIYLLLLFMYVPLVAQEQLAYQGPYVVSDYQGDADFEYLLVANDTVFNGAFSFKQKPKGLALTANQSFSFNGRFVNGKPDGFWRLQTGNFKTSGEGQVVDYQFQINLTGQQELTTGQFVQGIPQGLWVIQIDSIYNAKQAAGLFKSSFQFEKGVPQGILK